MRRLLGPIAESLAILAAIVVQIAPIDRDWIEQRYANGIYASAARTFVPLANDIPFTLGDVLLVGILAGIIALWVVRLRRRAGRRWTTFGALVLQTAAMAALVALWFDAAWALNYRRAPVIARIAYDESRVTPANVRAFSKRVIDDLNATAPRAHAEMESSEQMQTALAAAFAPVPGRLGDRWDVIVTRPKPTILDRWFATAGIGGQWDPFAFETILNSEFLPFELPFALAHEWGHVAGFGDESDANLIGALTTLRSHDPLVHYSGLFWTYGFLPEGDRRKFPVSPLVNADLTAARARFLRHYNPNVYALQWYVYDTFLKSNRVATGVVGYSLFVRTLVGTPMDARGLPQTRETEMK